MKTATLMALAAGGLLAGSAALADRIAGVAGIGPARPAVAAAAQAKPALRSGVVTALRADGTQIEIDGHWWLVKPERTVVLRKGLPVGPAALAQGQKLQFSLASTTPGESALGVVHVP